MNAKSSNNVENIRSEFQKLFEKSQEEHVEDRAQMLSYIFLSEAQKTMERKGWTRKRLAEEIGTSASYLTQLFRGDRLLNFKTVAKIEVALGFRFEVNVTADSGDNAGGYINYSEAEKLRLDNLQVNEP